MLLTVLTWFAITHKKITHHHVEFQWHRTAAPSPDKRSCTIVYTDNTSHKMPFIQRIASSPALPGSLEALRANFTVGRSGQPSPLSRSSAQHEHSMEVARELCQPGQLAKARKAANTACQASGMASCASKRTLVARPAHSTIATKPCVVVYTGLWTLEQLQQHEAHSDKLWLSEDGLETLQECDVAQVMTLDASVADTLGLKDAEQLTPASSKAGHSATCMLRTTMCRERVGAPWQTVGVTQCGVDDLSDIIPSNGQFTPVSAALQAAPGKHQHQAAEPSPWFANEPAATATQSIVCSDQELPSAFSFYSTFKKPAAAPSPPPAPAPVSTSPDTPTLLRSAPAGFLEQFKSHPTPDSTKQVKHHADMAPAPARNPTLNAPRKLASPWLRVNRGDTLAVAAMLDPPLWSTYKLTGLPAYLQARPTTTAWPRGGACAAVAGPLHSELGSLRKSSEPAMQSHHPRGLLAQLMC